MMKTILLTILCFSSASALAYRIPDSLSRGIYTSNEGFEINPEKTDWIRSSAPPDLKNKVEALFRLKNEGTRIQPTFTIRIDKDTPYKSLKEYSNKWLKSYGQFGLEVLGHQYFKNKKDQPGFVIDLANSISKKKLRQVIFFQNSKAVILTCMDQADNFTKALKPCNDLIKTFAWEEKTFSTPESLIK
jgi:hypothetical protein